MLVLSALVFTLATTMAHRLLRAIRVQPGLKFLSFFFLDLFFCVVVTGEWSVMDCIGVVILGADTDTEA